MNAGASITPAVPLDPRVKRTRELLRQALVSLLGEKSFEAISVQDIAERATVNRVTFYDHFNDKFALLEDLIAESFREMLRSRVARHEDGCHLRPLILAVCDYLALLAGRCCNKDHQPLFDPLVESTVKGLLREFILAELGGLPPEALRLPAEMAAPVAGWAIYGAVLEWSKGGFTPPAEAFADRILPAIAALLTAPGHPACEE